MKDWKTREIDNAYARIGNYRNKRRAVRGFVCILTGQDESTFGKGQSIYTNLKVIFFSNKLWLDSAFLPSAWKEEEMIRPNFGGVHDWEGLRTERTQNAVIKMGCAQRKTIWDTLRLKFSSMPSLNSQQKSEKTQHTRTCPNCKGLGNSSCTLCWHETGLFWKNFKTSRMEVLSILQLEKSLGHITIYG